MNGSGARGRLRKKRWERPKYLSAFDRDGDRDARVLAEEVLGRKRWSYTPEQWLQLAVLEATIYDLAMGNRDAERARSHVMGLEPRAAGFGFEDICLSLGACPVAARERLLSVNFGVGLKQGNFSGRLCHVVRRLSSGRQRKNLGRGESNLAEEFA